MKTILSLSAVLATISALGLLPLALADSKERKETAHPQAPEKAINSSKAPSVRKNPDTEKPSAGSKASSKPLTKATSKSSDSTGAGKSETTSLTPSQEDRLLTLLNEGTVEDLDAIPGIAATRADSIVSARPYASIHEIILIEGVGNATFEKVLAFGKLLNQRPTAAANDARKS
jgi:DNA uptake protein ComE-like DNA-binding protein